MSAAAIPRFSINESSGWSSAEESGMRYPRPLTRLQGRGRDYKSVVTLAPPPQPATRQVLPPKVQKLPPEVEDAEPNLPRPGLLGRLGAFLRSGAPAAKRLRLAETVALGEKRFVAIIHAEGRKYLVGGGTSGVALLTCLDDSAKPMESLSQLK